MPVKEEEKGIFLHVRLSDLGKESKWNIVSLASEYSSASAAHPESGDTYSVPPDALFCFLSEKGAALPELIVLTMVITLLPRFE